VKPIHFRYVDAQKMHHMSQEEHGTVKPIHFRYVDAQKMHHIIQEPQQLQCGRYTNLWKEDPFYRTQMNISDRSLLRPRHMIIA